ncbi:DUF2079 domain-containing protein [Vibrio owensii]|uniref:DUF2079 domain-containing protein n=1 Tax=Vibrio owensii TaxID=696485 RepID=UPI00148E6CC6|nr:DUF2079 domain-containing protein [Vibrio owensii]MCR9939997.1 DUF2079 domain-containing protein [Vibrio owensii]NOI71798.1 DUF2079 domain-containing protein [Vibrio owensii]
MYLSGLLLLAGLTSFCFYFGYQKILTLASQIGDVAVHSRFDLAMIPFGFVLLGGLISALFFAFKKKRWDEVYGNGLQYLILGSLAVSIVLTLITPWIYQTRYDNAGLKECSRSPEGYLPFFATKFAREESLCITPKTLQQPEDSDNLYPLINKD